MNDTVNNANIESTATLTRSARIELNISIVEKRIEADNAKLTALRQELETVAKLEGVGVGSNVTVKLGRAETTREVAAQVVGVKTEDNGSRKFKVLFGEGLDTDTAIVQESQIISVQG